MYLPPPKKYRLLPPPPGKDLAESHCLKTHWEIFESRRCRYQNGEFLTLETPCQLLVKFKCKPRLGRLCIYSQITKFRIGDDGYGRGRTMFVEEVTVTNKQGDTVVFPCRCWLGKDDSNGTIIRELIPGKPVPEELEGKYYMFAKVSKGLADPF